MRTARLFTAGGVWSGEVWSWGGWPYLPPDRMTDACENIPATLAGGNKKNHEIQGKDSVVKKVNVFQVNFYLEAPSIHMSGLQSKIHFGFLTQRSVSFVRLFKYQIITTFVLFLSVPNSKVISWL